MRVLRPVLFVLVGMAVGAGGWWLLAPTGGPVESDVVEGTPSDVAPAPTAPVEDASGDVTVLAGTPSTAEGEVEPLRSAAVAFPIAGLLAERYVEIGDAVEAGDPLLRLVDDRERTRLREAEAAQAAAEASLEAASAGVLAAERQVTVAEAAVEVARAQRDAAQAAFRLTATQAEATVEQAQAGTRQADAAVAQAEAQAAGARAALDQARAQVGLAEAQVTQAVAAVETARVAVEERTLRAPFAGRVLDVTSELGEPVTVATTVTVADVSGWRVATTNLTELQVVAVDVGDVVTVEVDALPGRTFEGRVEQVAFEPRVVRGDVTYVATVRLVDAALSDADRRVLRPGMTAVVRDLLE